MSAPPEANANQGTRARAERYETWPELQRAVLTWCREAIAKESPEFDCAALEADLQSWISHWRRTTTRLTSEWFASLEDFDRRIAEVVAAAGCRHCGGPLHQGNYKRKPRGGNIAEAGEAFRLRHSLCCGCEGCRRRALPPSLRFLGRRVYLEAVLASALALALETLRLASEITGVPARTLRRWHTWWTGSFPSSAV